MNRRQAHHKGRREYHARMRAVTVIRQEHESSREGPVDSPKAQKAQVNLKSRKPLCLCFLFIFDKVKKGCGLCLS